MGNFIAQAFALATQHVAQALQLENDAVDFLDRGVGDLRQQPIQLSGSRVSDGLSISVNGSVECRAGLTHLDFLQG